jgi:hypothetical protein
MSNGAQFNLDRLAAHHAQEIIRRLVDEDKNGNRRTDSKEVEKVASSVDNTITKALGVLQENGVYACFLYLLAKEGDSGRVVVDEMLNLLDGLGFDWGKPDDNSAEKVLAHINGKVTVELERLLLAKETLEQMLIYARYGAKARG